MTQLNITINLENLKEKVENSSLETPVKSSLVLMLNSLMEKERDEHISAPSHKRTAERTGYRNGYYERDLITGAGSLKLRVPRTRDGKFSPSIFRDYERYDQALVLSMMEMVINGVSTRKVSKIVEELCGKKVSKSFVSNLTKELDPIVNEWRNRPLNVYYFPYIYVDAMYIKVREDRKVVSKAVYIACGVNDEGYREIIGMHIDHKESEESWSTFLESLKARGIQSPKMIVSDAHKGLVKAIGETFLGTSWQRCVVHFLRNMVNKLPKKNTLEIREDLKAIFKTPKLKHARELKDQFIEKYEEVKCVQKTIEILEEGFEDAMQYHAHSSKYHQHLRTTNMLERVNKEVRRREKVISIFPNDQSAVRLIGAVLMDINESWEHKQYLISYEAMSN